MSTVQLLADSTTIILNGRVMNDLVDGDTITLTPVNELTSRTRSVRSLNIQKRSDGGVIDVAFTVPKYSDDDTWLTSQLNQDVPVNFNGSCKENYTKDGVEMVKTYTLENGSFTTQPTDTRNNQDGNNEMTYTIQFDQHKRT